MDKMMAKYGSNRDLNGLPSSATTTPSIILKARIEHQTLVPYDASELQLMASRDPYPAIYSDPSVLTPNRGVVGRGAPNLKPKGTAELMQVTQNDEG